jgi:hypothetical protein
MVTGLHLSVSKLCHNYIDDNKHLTVDLKMVLKITSKKYTICGEEILKTINNKHRYVR